MVVKLADFGLSAQIDFPNQKRKTVCGTPNYIAPEVLKNLGHDHMVDNWALGVITYTFLIGKPPFEEKENSTENQINNQDDQQIYVKKFNNTQQASFFRFNKNGQEQIYCIKQNQEVPAEITKRLTPVKL
ncbi:protein kinase domain protein [Ichthyophthirius multifiliis]|uniref:Protein kinase domain protein n=1 Tax=Ichthyophthirius multifiliis TaxID=5932 RepID=G0R0G2_ICHMU|nr:protein kinase domain protein [Ichthyophthirius multifiliis]EGR29041.1 protein kinase domain protein [Ichthyophthirius multifiliis]|eukprot:XP_004030277.1 protein kinase domain protein [Ichthyophthirius multifiliis]